MATCFCTPDARILHAVGGPVSADRMLKEARWALAAHRELRENAPADLEQRAALMRKAHLGALNASPEAFEGVVRSQLPAAQAEYVRKVQEYRKSRGEGKYRRPDPIAPPMLTALRNASRKFPGDRAHQLLAAEPLAPFAVLRERVFEKLTGELYAEKRNRVFLAAQGLKTARERKLPVLLLLYKGRGKQKDEYDDATEQLLTQVFRQRPVSQPLQSYVVIAIPLRELAALTQLAELPAFELAAKSSTNLILLGVDGKQFAAMPGSTPPDQLAFRLWPALNESFLTRAEGMAKNHKLSDALRLLRRILGTPIDEHMKQRVDRRINQITVRLAQRWADDGRTLNALRLFRRVQLEASDDELRQLAEERISALRSKL